MLLPRFPAIIASGRLGTVDAEPDRDGVVRRFGLYEDAGAWRIPSLPLTMGKGLGFEIPDERLVQLNWRGAPFSYRFVPFHEVYLDLLRKERRRDPKEFAGKIVLIGSTAPALFDLRATPMASVHPGVEILATAIDNLKNRDYFRTVSKDVSLAISLVLVWTLALGLRSWVRGSLNTLIAFTVQVILLLLAFASMNFTHYYIDLVGPFSLGLMLLLLLGIRADLRERAAQVDLAVMRVLERGTRYRVLFLFIESRKPRQAARTRAWLLDRICTSHARGRLADPPYGGNGLLGADFASLTIAYWLVPEGDEAGATAASEERQRLAKGIERRERAGAKMVERETAFDWTGERPGVVGRLLLDALQDLRQYQ